METGDWIALVLLAIVFAIPYVPWDKVRLYGGLLWEEATTFLGWDWTRKVDWDRLGASFEPWDSL